MSVRLEEHGVYLLPNALNGQEYAVLEAIQTKDGWQLVECHAAPSENDRFHERAGLPADQMIRYAVTPDGTLVDQTAGSAQADRGFTLANLSLLGYLRDGNYVSAAETE